jgi:FkbM family methyltransferase
MKSTWVKTFGRELFKWYLANFPLRDGKATLYQYFNRRLAPEERYVVTRLPAGFRMRLDLMDEPQRKIYFYGTYDERYEMALVRRVLDAPDVFWDIGANVGFYSLLTARLLSSGGQVIAFEPGQLAFQMLEENLALNQFDNVTSFNVAVTEDYGEAVLYSSPGVADGGANLFQPDETHTLTQTCRTVSLDRFSRETDFPRRTFIKVDVEGAEMAVLRGAADLLASDQPLWLMEMKESVLRAAGTEKGAIQDLFRRHGYAPAFLHRRKWFLSKDVREVKSRNILWFKPSLPSHREKAARVPVRGAF